VPVRGASLVVHPRLDRPARDHHRASHHGEVPGIDALVAVSRNGRPASERAVPRDHREKLARAMAKQCRASRPRIRTTLPGHTAVLKPWGPGAVSMVEYV
jgi:hypothetical protein